MDFVGMALGENTNEQVSKNDELCIKNEELRLRNGDFFQFQMMKLAGGCELLGRFPPVSLQGALRDEKTQKCNEKPLHAMMTHCPLQEPGSKRSA